jgi:RNA polymerase sigma-70 factor (ECF subfamily)
LPLCPSAPLSLLLCAFCVLLRFLCLHPPKFPEIFFHPTRSTSMYAVAERPMPLEDDFENIYKAHYRRVFSLCRYLLNSADAAEDATHEVFLRAQRRFDTYDSSLPLSSWLLGIASHHCIDILRRRGVETRLFEIEAEGFEPSARGPNPLAELIAAERGDEVRHALRQLPEKFRVPLVLAYYNELRYDEIGEMLGLKRNHVATLLFRAKQLLRAKLASKEKRRGLSK